MKTRNDLPAFLNGLGLTGLGVEMGVSRGEFSQFLLENWSGRRLFLVDAWRYFCGEINVNNPDHNGHLDCLAETFRRVYPYGSRAIIIRDLSIMAADLFANESLDFVYLDGGHDYQNVKQDLEAWYPKVKRGGLFAGHDYFVSLPHQNHFNAAYEVPIAVEEFAKSYGLSINTTTEDYPSWYFQVG